MAPEIPEGDANFLAGGADKALKDGAFRGVHQATGGHHERTDYGYEQL